MRKKAVIVSSKAVLGGTPVFAGTRVPFRVLMDYLEGGESLDTFLNDFPSVKKRQAVEALEMASDALLHEAIT